MLNHLLFEDNCVLFGRANLDERQKFNNLLSIYEDASNQNLNKQKTSLFFNSNTKKPIKEEIQKAIKASENSSYDKYLSLPTIMGGQNIIHLKE